MQKADMRLNLSQITLWSCCWANASKYLTPILRVLRYCHRMAEFHKITLFSYQRVPRQSFPLEVITIPQLTPWRFNIFQVHTAPYLLPETYCMSVHDDAFPINWAMWSKRFMAYDFCGSPWFDGVVGNNAFCLESPEFLRAKANLPNFTRRAPIPTTLGDMIVEPADTYVCRTHRKTMEDQGMRFAPREVAIRFSTENVDKNRTSFGFHGRNYDPVKYQKGWDLIHQSEL